MNIDPTPKSVSRMLDMDLNTAVLEVRGLFFDRDWSHSGYHASFDYASDPRCLFCNLAYL